MNKSQIMNKRYLLNQVNCILSLDRNRQGDYKNISELFSTYNTILNNKSSKNFQKSMDNTKATFVDQCNGNKNSYDTKVQALEKNVPDSFLIVPMVSTNHCFCAVVRKTDEGFSATLVNASKGGRRGDDRGNHVGYEEYIFTAEHVSNMLKAFDRTSLYNSDRDHRNSLTNSGIYDLYEQLADKRYALNILSRDQKDGNCFVKEPEKAIKYALATVSFNEKQLQNLRRADNKPFTPKWTISTEEVHRLYIEQLKIENPNKAQVLEERYNKYLDYKHYVSQEKGKKLPINGRSMEFTSKIDFQDNNADPIGTAKRQKGDEWTYYDKNENVVGYSKKNEDKIDYFDAKQNYIGYSKKEGIGEKYYDANSKMTGYTRHFFGMKDYSGDISREHKGMLALDRMIELSKTKQRTPLEERMLERKLMETSATARVNTSLLMTKTKNQELVRAM